MVLKKAALMLSLPLMLFATIQPAHAEETNLPITILTVELDDINAVDSIKSQLVEKKVDESMFPGMKANIDIANSEIKLEGLDITKLGQQDVMVHMTMKVSSIKTELLFNNVIQEKIKVEVVDTTAPTIALRYDAIRLDFEEELDPYEWIDAITDNSHQDMANISVDTTSLDISTPGEYEVYYSAEDVNGNVGYATLRVTVKKKKVAYSNYGASSDSITSMLNLMNNKRAEYGLDALSLGSSDAQSAIGVRACEAASNVSHTRPDGRHYKTAFDDYGVSYSKPYEILTYSGSSVQDKFNWWMSSSGHRSIILRSTGTKVAIGYCGKMWAAIVYND